MGLERISDGQGRERGSSAAEERREGRKQEKLEQSFSALLVIWSIIRVSVDSACCVVDSLQ